MNTPCRYEVYEKVGGGESGKVGGREREKVGWGESGKVRWGERVDGIRGLEQREVAEIRVERSGTQSVCEYGVFDTKNRKCWISEHYAFGVRGLSSSARGTGFSAMQERLFGQTEEALRGHETGFSVTGEGSGKCLKMGKRGCEKAETGRL